MKEDNNYRFYVVAVIAVLLSLFLMYISYGCGFREGKTVLSTDITVVTHNPNQPYPFTVDDEDIDISDYTVVTDKDYALYTVYWVSGGSVWHTTEDCRSLARSVNIESGSVDESGKARACKICG